MEDLLLNPDEQDRICPYRFAIVLLQQQKSESKIHRFLRVKRYHSEHKPSRYTI